MSLPTQHIEEAWQSAEFYANKVLMEFRNTEPAHVDWIKNLKDVLLKMKDHVQKHHRAGPSWNPKGIPISAFLPSSTSAATSVGDDLLKEGFQQNQVWQCADASSMVI